MTDAFLISVQFTVTLFDSIFIMERVKKLILKRKLQKFSHFEN